MRLRDAQMRVRLRVDGNLRHFQHFAVRRDLRLTAVVLQYGVARDAKLRLRAFAGGLRFFQCLLIIAAREAALQTLLVETGVFHHLAEGGIIRARRRAGKQNS